MSTQSQPETEVTPPLLAFAQLLRLPNVFTAVADILLGFWFTHAPGDDAALLVTLIAASCLLYLAGMVLNDVFDFDVDSRERPERPLPSGAISMKVAKSLGWGLLFGGVALGWAASAQTGDLRSGLVATALAAAVVLYDGVLKKTPLAPLSMGSCRFLNVLLGMSAAATSFQSIHYVVAAGVGVYIVGVTWFARTEARHSNRLPLTLATLVLLSGLGILAWYPSWAVDFEPPTIHLPANWLLFWLMIGVLIGQRCFRAIIDPRPPLVQAAVKTCILTLIMLDAAALLPVQDMIWSAAILGLWIPTVLVGRWVYST